MVNLQSTHTHTSIWPFEMARSRHADRRSNAAARAGGWLLLARISPSSPCEKRWEKTSGPPKSELHLQSISEHHSIYVGATRSTSYFAHCTSGRTIRPGLPGLPGSQGPGVTVYLSSRSIQALNLSLSGDWLVWMSFGPL